MTVPFPSRNESGLARDAAGRYLNRGWSVVPIPHGEKNPGFKGWQRPQVTSETIGVHFNGRPQNIGVLLGEPSGWLIDIDLDHPKAVALAPDFLPHTPSIFGRFGKPRSHWLYRVDRPVATKKFRSKSAGMIVELRSTGAQTVFPPSTHESGELIEWVDERAEPASIDSDQLLESVMRLADAVKLALGEKAPPNKSGAKSKKRKNDRKAPVEGDARLDATLAMPTSRGRVNRCLNAMCSMHMVDQNDGSSRLYACACRIVEHDLDDAQGLSVLREYAEARPFPRTWSDDEILRRLRDAEKTCTRGAAFQAELDEGGLIALGSRDPVTAKLVLSPKRTLPTAAAYVSEFHGHPDGRTIHSHAGQLLVWRQNRYVALEDAAVRQQLHSWLHAAQSYLFSRAAKTFVLRPFDANPGTVSAALETIRAFVHLPAHTTPPFWLRQQEDDLKATEIVACRSMLLHLPTMVHISATPSFFTTHALPFDHDPTAPEPILWRQFLHQLFDRDVESLELLQEWFGYCLTSDTSQQKMLLMVGQKRAGKGTIARVLRQLIGPGNACGPSTSNLSGPFGLQPLIGKTLAIISDARFSGENIATVVERLLCISGEDALTIDRKFLDSVTMKLPTRFMFLSNELPRLTDSSGALAGRFVILRLTRSFYGKEDPHLTQKLLTELPGILNWAIQGWRRLNERGHFVNPQSVQDVMSDLEDVASPVGAFVRETCVVKPGYRVLVEHLYNAWKQWCQRNGRIESNKQAFGRNLAAAVPGIYSRRGANNVRFYEGIDLTEQP